MLRRIMRSNLWPVAAYLTMALWFIVVNQHHIGLNFNTTSEQFYALAQLDAVAHFSVALSLAATFTPVFGKKWTLGRLIIIVIGWELVEMLVLSVFRPNIFSQPGRLGLLDLVYFYDTLDDIALGIAGTLAGVYHHGTEPSNTPSA
mgnify:FL=1